MNKCLHCGEEIHWDERREQYIHTYRNVARCKGKTTNATFDRIAWYG